MRSGVIERQHGLGAVALDYASDAIMNDVQRLIPGGALEVTFPFRADTLEGISQAIGAMHKLGITVGHLGAEGAVGNGIDLRSAHGEHLITGHGHGETAGIRAVERTDAGLLHAHGAILIVTQAANAANPAEGSPDMVENEQRK